MHCPCFNHALNLSVGKANQLPCVRNTVGTIKEILNFFKSSSKRIIILKNILKRQLPGLCETRWIEKHEGIIKFQENMVKISDALDNISNWEESQSSSKARILQAGMCDSTFIVTVTCLSDVLPDTLPLSWCFQKTDLDVKSARDMLHNTLCILDDKRKNSLDLFKKLFLEIESIASELDVEIKAPRKTKIQTHRNNVPADSLMDYFRLSIYIPIIEHIAEDLRSRFKEETLQLYNLSMFLPLSNTDQSQETNALSQFQNLLGRNFSEKIISSEMNLWQTKWRQEAERGNVVPQTAIEALSSCDKDIFPNIYIFLSILTTLPVSIAGAERSFSVLRRLKTWLRSTMTDDRLTGLALLNIHYEMNINIENIIDRFAKSATRRNEFIM